VFVKSHFNVRLNGMSVEVSASLPMFKNALRRFLRWVRVDSDWYLRTYPAAAEGIADGTWQSAQEHFVEQGYFEGCLPFPSEDGIDRRLTDNSADTYKCDRIGMLSSHGAVRQVGVE